jgi:hypothetical protein
MADYNWDMTGPPDAVTIATDPEAVQSYNEWLRRKQQERGENFDVSASQQQEITPPTYEQQVEKAQSIGMSQEEIAQQIGTPEDAKQRDIDTASNIYNLYGFTPTWAEKAGYTVNQEQQATAIKNSGINFNPNLSSSDPVISAYNAILGRNPTQSEYDGGIQKMGADNLGFPSLISDISISSEAKSLLDKGVIGQSTLDKANKELPGAFGYLYPRPRESFLHGAGGFLGDVIRYGVPAIMAIGGGYAALGGEAAAGAAAGAEAAAGGSGELGLLGATGESAVGQALPYTTSFDAANLYGQGLSQAAIEQNLVMTGIDPFLAADAASLASQGLSDAAIAQNLAYGYTPTELAGTGIESLSIQPASPGFGDYLSKFGNLLKAPALLAPGLLSPLSMLPKTPTSAQPTGSGSYVPRGMVDYGGILNLLAPKTATRTSLLG